MRLIDADAFIKEAERHTVTISPKDTPRDAVRNMGRKFRELIENAPTVTPRAEWISVEERLPDVCGRPVLMVAENEYGQTNVVKGFTDYTCPIVFQTSEMEYYGIWHAWKVTHWMPLPEPPKGE